MTKHELWLWVFAVSCSAAITSPAHAGCFDPRSVIKVMRSPAPHGPVILAHRGLWLKKVATTGNLPENSIASLNAAEIAGSPTDLKHCIEAVEMDIKTTKDNVAVISHDFNLGGATTIPRNNFSAYTNTGDNPRVDAVNFDRFNEIFLRDGRYFSAPSTLIATSFKNILDYYYYSRSSSVIALDIKTKNDAIAVAKILSEDDRDFSHGKTEKLKASDFVIFKLNATIWPDGGEYIQDMKMAGVDTPPMVIVIYTTNMESALGCVCICRISMRREF
ncbi:glycerophosphodiester phosphodiesterase family protein [Sphingomonadaceae bacterium jetA1]|jgi:glycerophosphoryl diester phosphodiesterase|uniref:glycerophosphodiester phosphodiesterase family protein n=1 Tax=Facivitalis istanbulensis TaxID=3075838 RepID=UPI0034757775